MIHNIKTHIRKPIFSAVIGLLALLSHTLAVAQDHVINLKDADIRAFIEDTSVVTGKTFIVDPRVTGIVSVSSQAKLSKTEVFQVFLDVLRVRGFTAIPAANNAYRITLIQGAAQDAPLSKRAWNKGLFSTEILKLSRGNATDAVKLIKPVLHTQGRISANAGGRVLVITDYPENIRKARKIIDAMNVDHAAVVSIPLQNLNANNAMTAIRSLMGDSRTSGRSNSRSTFGHSVKAAAIEATNSLILRGDPGDVEQVRKLVLEMDSAGIQKRGQISVIPLRYASGEDIVKILEKILPTYDSKIKTDSKPSVAHEPGSNSLIISAKPEIQTSLEMVVRRLDVRRPQVLVEAIIVEISETAAEDLGVQFILAGNENSSLPFISTNYSRSAPNLLAITGALAGSNLDTLAHGNLQDAAVSSLLGLQGGTIGIGGNGSSGLFGAVLNAVQRDTDSNVLSTPFVTTLDNVPATFLVGQEVPLTSGETLGNNNNNIFRSIQRQEIGIKLEVLPQINEGDAVRLEIKQEVSSIAVDASTIASDLVINKREISTTVLADDGEIIVLGGLMQDDEQLFRSKVPILGDIPGVGNLFKSHNNTRKRTNLMVFIRPTIIRNGRDAAPITQSKLNYIRAEERAKHSGAPSKLDTVLREIQVHTPNP